MKTKVLHALAFGFLLTVLLIPLLVDTATKKPRTPPGTPRPGLPATP